MDKVTLNKKLQALVDACETATSREDVEKIVREIVMISDNHPLFNTFVDKLCEKFSISAEMIDTAVEAVKEFFDSLLGYKLRPVTAVADTELLAEAVVAKYRSTHGGLNMKGFKLICSRCGFVCTLPSTAKISNIIANYVD